MIVLPPDVSAVSPHHLKVAMTLLQVGCFLVIFLAARAIAELTVRLQLPTILGELVAGVLIGASGLHLIVPPDGQALLSEGAARLVGGLADIFPRGRAAGVRSHLPQPSGDLRNRVVCPAVPHRLGK